MRGRPFSESGLLAWGSRIHSATKFISWHPKGLRIFLAAFIATLALLGLRSVAMPAMAAPVATIMHAPSDQIARDGEQSTDTPATGSPEQIDGAVAGQATEDVAPGSDVSEPEQGGDAPSTRITPTSRGGSRAPDSLSISPAPETMQSSGISIAAIARKYIGYPYRWAGMSPRTGFDCSGLMTYVYQEAGVNIPAHSLAGMLNTGKRVDRGDLQPGDLVFFENTYEWGLSHGGIYVGDGQFVHAETEGIGVVASSLNSGNWASHYLGASRPW